MGYGFQGHGQPDDLLAAIERQSTAPVLPMGQALTNIGLATPRQIERALAVQAKHPERPLGQILVAPVWSAKPISRPRWRTSWVARWSMSIASRSIFGPRLGCRCVP